MQTKHEYVDLGLPSGTLWATCNVGANEPWESGDFFAWGKKWRMPTKEEVVELKSLQSEEFEMNGVKGIKLVGSNSNTVFLPFTSDLN